MIDTRKYKNNIYILILALLSVMITQINCQGSNKFGSKQDKMKIKWPDTSTWQKKKLKGVELLIPPNWNATYSEYNGIGLEIYPNEFYYIKSDLLTPHIHKAWQYEGTLEEFKNDDLVNDEIRFDMIETKEWLSYARSNIIWHINSEDIVYIEAMDGQEKTFSCYGTRMINEIKYWFEFDGLHYKDDEIIRLTEEDCLMAILVFKSISEITD